MTWHVLAWIASGGPIPVPYQPGQSASIHLNSDLITALVIGIPATLVAIGSYWLSLRARRETADATSDQVDAAAYIRAKDLYESAISELRQQGTELRAEIGRLHEEIDELRGFRR